MASLVGSRVERKEDKALTGRGKYTADVTFLAIKLTYFVRSPHARAQSKMLHQRLKKSSVAAVLLEKILLTIKLEDYSWMEN